MKQIEKIHISPTMLGVLLTTAIALFVGAEKFGDLNGRLKVIEGKTDFTELRVQQDKISKTINEQILGAERKLKVLKEGLTAHQNAFSSKYSNIETKFNNNLKITLSKASKQIENLTFSHDRSIDKSKTHKENILQELRYGIDHELYRVNNLTKKLQRNLKRLKIEVARKESQLSRLKKITASEIRIKEEQLSSLKNKYNAKMTAVENNSNDPRPNKPQVKVHDLQQQSIVSKKVLIKKYYTVQVAALRNKRRAKKIYKDLMRGGFSAFLIKNETTGLIYVRVGKYNTRKEATNIRRKMKKRFPHGRNVKKAIIKQIG